MKVSIVIPTLNAGNDFGKLLNILQNQQFEHAFEILVIDSGSCDQTLAICHQYQVKVIGIPPNEFGHGRTRNLGVAECRGEYVAFLTQDALPVDNKWLTHLTTPLDQDPRIAGVFGRHLAYPGAGEFLQRDMQLHFDWLQSCGHEFDISTDRSRFDRELSYRQAAHFYSDNNSCLRRKVWEQIPYRNVDYAEDQLWAQDILEAGYKKAYAHEAAVYHSHFYRGMDAFQRAFEEGYYLRQHFGYTHLVPSKQALFKQIAHVWRHNYRFLHSRKDITLRAYWDYAFAKTASTFGYYLGQRKEKIPRFLLRGCFRDVSLRRKYAADIDLNNLARQVKSVAVRFGELYNTVGLKETSKRIYRKLHRLFLTAAAPSAQKTADVTCKVPSLAHFEQGILALKEFGTPIVDTSLEGLRNTVNFFIPDIGIGSGGHLNIFRFCAELEKHGYHINFITVAGSQYPSGSKAVEIINKHFVPLKTARVYIDYRTAPNAFISFASSWHTAYFLRAFTGTIHKLYFVQDYEPYFYPMGSQYFLAEQTYRFGFKAITAGKWLTDKISSDFGCTSRWFGFSYEKNLYSLCDKRDNEKVRIFFYARPFTERRLFELGVKVLEKVKEIKGNKVEVVMAGQKIDPACVAFKFTNLGVVPLADLGELYNTCHMALVFSGTNLSLLPLELMACGVVVVSNRGPNVEWGVSSDNAILVDWDFTTIVDELCQLVEQPERRLEISKRALAYVQSTDWDTEYGRGVEAMKELIHE